MSLKIFIVLFLWCFSVITACQTRIKSPVLELRPLPKEKYDTLIWVKSSDRTQHWIDDINSFFKQYHARVNAENLVSCSYNEPPPENRICDVNVERELGSCGAQHFSGYDRGAPCIFLSFSQVPKGWSPIYYNPTNTPTEMPKYLKDIIRAPERRETQQQVWVSCEGENAADVENIGPIQYFPDVGFPAYSFLNSHVRGYLSSVVAVQFLRPTRGIVIMMRCTAWAKNIPRDPADKIGTVHFELLVE